MELVLNDALHNAIIIFIIGAVLGRIKGGLGNEFVRKRLKKPEGWEIPNSIIRGIWALAVSGVFVAYTSEYLYSPIVFGLAYLGALHGYFKGKFDLALPENRNPRNYARLTLAAMARTAPLALAFWFTPYADAFWLGTFAGAMAAPAGLLGVVMHRYWKIQGHTQWAEAILYGSILTAIATQL